MKQLNCVPVARNRQDSSEFVQDILLENAAFQGVLPEHRIAPGCSTLEILIVGAIS